MTHLRKIMLEELERRNYAQTTIDCYIRTVEHFSRYFHRSPDQLGPQHIRPALGTRLSLSVSGACVADRCSPSSAPFPPRPPQEVAFPCSVGSQVV
ncbi:MAG TPA: phage integrase N-terminal SAM-like domain-containing protein, partial [Candidatus Limnocylindrales bacterium]|nr:phage integrase N-terminal SAM-like domain-containing protein [Candidatus Limnocylindrales bacterium]